MRRRILIISGHDFRSRRKASIHFIAQRWAESHDVRFFSTGFSLLSQVKGDMRLDLLPSANQVVHVDGVDCYLQRTMIHPVSLPGRTGRAINARWIRHYARRAPQVLRQWVSDSDVIVIDAGLALAYMPLLDVAGRHAQWLYHASDRLTTIGASANLEQLLQDHVADFAAIRVPASQMAADFPHGRVKVLPHGIDPACEEGRTLPRPFGPGQHAVAVGSMLFDPDAINRIAVHHKEMTIHVIGAGKAATAIKGPNIRCYPEMPFAMTQAYIFHADLAIAPYDLSRVESYLGESSLKLAQYGFHGVPAVCPENVVAGRRGRFGYHDTASSLDAATDAALRFGRFDGGDVQRWEGTADAFLATGASAAGAV